MHEVEVHIIRLQILQRGRDSLGDTLVPRVVKLRGDPDLLTRNAGVLDSLANFGFVSVRESAATRSEQGHTQFKERRMLRVNVTVASKERVLHGFTDFVGLGLPGSQTDTGHLSTSVQSEHGPCKGDDCQHCHLF